MNQQNNTYQRLLLSFALFISVLGMSAQTLTNKIYQHKIKTVQCHKYGWALSYPIIGLNGDHQIILSFDDLDVETKDFYYTLIHCNENWEPSQLMDTEYVNGFNENPILDYAYSFNTSVEYVHYSVILPNDNIDILLSGNYIIKVYADGNPENVVLTQRFMVTEQAVKVSPTVKYTMNANLRKAQQEIALVIEHSNFDLVNPMEEVKVHIFQNGRTDNAITNLQPQFIKHNELDYNYNREIMFEGGNEFRWLDIRSLRFQSTKVREVSYHEPYTHVDLFPDQSIAGKSYYFNNDFNGRYVIEVQEKDDNEREAEYVFVHFSLPSDPMAGGDVHILGGLTDWLLNDHSKMQYNFQRRQYEATLLLKQGFYNYQIAFKPNSLRKATVSLFEGSHSETENDYLVLVYYRGMSDYYDRLIGVSQVNSMNNRE